MATKKQRSSAKQIMREMRDLINQWDPIGLLEMGAPDDEYECLVGPVLTRLSKRSSPQDLAVWLKSHITDHFGLAPSPAEPFAEKAVALYRNRTTHADTWKREA